MRTFLKWLSGIILILITVYFAGPKPKKPDFAVHDFNLPASLVKLDDSINKAESLIKGLKPDNQARIVWADSLNKTRTRISFLYLHGFSASQAEGDPVHRDLARKYNANLYLARLSEHGISNGDSTLINLDAGEWEASAEHALEIAKKLGDEVVVIGTSAGGTLTLFLASRHPEIKAIVLYSPCVRLFDPNAFILNMHWGLQLAKLVTGSPVKSFKSSGNEHSNYWQLSYRVEALVALQNLISNTMKPEIFQKIKEPAFLGYYYKDQVKQDSTVSVSAMLKMYEELGTPAGMKEKIAFPNAGAHVIGSHIRSKDWQSVEMETDKFLREIVKL